ncbi:sulfite exporter TauE/SafE family protein [Dyella tabacisoli]|uniref:Probable membrane transporter protein n=1 Tax=Dyella tabacisoli TaxID=2282381 RepID=A0A369UL13_9GAMM|nr:sulfite exporter TauE/SafE family protein [Dyella tabacisoli]RDD81197.1 sulfite exporter TauE/SafE family protein [Dyella tabacisoli]
MPSEFVTFALVGALAQVIDGSLGMAFGVASTAMLLGLGLPPAVASASVHYAETFTCGASGISHLIAGNVRRRLFFSLMIPGVIGAVIGACVVSYVPASWMRLALTPYLLGMGVFLLLRASRNSGHSDEVLNGTRPLGLVAGFADAVAGGGWSALTVTSLVARGNTPRIVIGTTHLAKCVVSASASLTFLWHVGATHGTAVLGLILGGALASPFSALFAKVIPARVVTTMAAIAVLGLGLSNVVKAFQ